MVQISFQVGQESEVSLSPKTLRVCNLFQLMMNKLFSVETFHVAAERADAACEGFESFAACVTQAEVVDLCVSESPSCVFVHFQGVLRAGGPPSVAVADIRGVQQGVSGSFETSVEVDRLDHVLLEAPPSVCSGGTVPQVEQVDISVCRDTLKQLVVQNYSVFVLFEVSQKLQSLFHDMVELSPRHAVQKHNVYIRFRAPNLSIFRGQQFGLFGEPQKLSGVSLSVQTVAEQREVGTRGQGKAAFEVQKIIGCVNVFQNVFGGGFGRKRCPGQGSSGG